MNGFLNLLKPPGMTSHDVVAVMRRTLGEKKIGHCGTLDPQAAGVLPLCLGQATRLADYLSGGEKSYYCEMKLGFETDTQDVWGNTTWINPAGIPGPGRDRAKAEDAARSLEGEILQEVPAYSSVKREGKSLYAYAREGMLHTGLSRPVSVRSIRIAGLDGDTLRFVVECGAGTYVRMICRDIGRKLGCGGAMSFLLRLSVGPFLLEDSVTLEEIRERADSGAMDAIIAPGELALARLPRMEAGVQEAGRIRCGQSVWLLSDAKDEGRAWASDGQGRLIALGCSKPGSGSRAGQALFKPDKVFSSPNA